MHFLIPNDILFHLKVVIPSTACREKYDFL
eukprot:UN08316